jgi:hypothetical protein
MFCITLEIGKLLLHMLEVTCTGNFSSADCIVYDGTRNRFKNIACGCHIVFDLQINVVTEAAYYSKATITCTALDHNLILKQIMSEIHLYIK